MVPAPSSAVLRVVIRLVPVASALAYDRARRRGDDTLSGAARRRRARRCWGGRADAAPAGARGRRTIAHADAFSHCSYASNACGRPRKSFTSSAAGFEPPASRIALR